MKRRGFFAALATMGLIPFWKHKRITFPNGDVPGGYHKAFPCDKGGLEWRYHWVDKTGYHTSVGEER